jgi:hypothetical protein
MLETEIAYYEKHKEQLLAKHAGQIVLVKGEALIGVFNTIDEALTEGARRFGLQSMLVRQVTPVEKFVYVPALALGVLRANPEHSD